LAFTAELLSYSNSELCSMVFDDDQQSQNKVMPKNTQTMASDLIFDELLDNDSDDEFNTISTEDEIAEIESYKNSENQSKTDGTDYQNITLISNQDYKKIRRFLAILQNF
jgi:hypothetical protein